MQKHLLDMAQCYDQPPPLQLQAGGNIGSLRIDYSSMAHTVWGDTFPFFDLDCDCFLSFVIVSCLCTLFQRQCQSCMRTLHSHSFVRALIHSMNLFHVMAILRDQSLSLVSACHALYWCAMSVDDGWFLSILPLCKWFSRCGFGIWPCSVIMSTQDLSWIMISLL